jgi:hypothetical protein
MMHTRALVVTMTVWGALAARAEGPVTDKPTEAAILLERAARAPHNGHNPQLDVAADVLVRLAPALEDSVASGACAVRRDAVSLLSRIPSTPERRAFWVAQLSHKDLVVRFFAIAKLADLADPSDFEAVASQVVAAPPMRHMISVRLRDWKDRRAVPVLAELLETPQAANAALSLEQLPFCPKLPPDTAPAEHHESGAWIQQTDGVAPYRRWWKEKGAAQFQSERAWWTALRARTKPEADLITDAPCPKP